MKKAGCLLGLLLGCSLHAMESLSETLRKEQEESQKTLVIHANEADQTTFKAQGLLKEWLAFERESHQIISDKLSKMMESDILEINKLGVSVVLTKKGINAFKGVISNYEEALTLCKKFEQNPKISKISSTTDDVNPNQSIDAVQSYIDAHTTPH